MSSIKIKPTINAEAKRRNKGSNNTEHENERRDGNGNHQKYVKASQQEAPKSSSRFRIKPGCIVAYRFRSDVCKTIEASRYGPKRNREDINVINFDDSFIQAWVDPLPKRDERLALIGKRIRCFFEKREGVGNKRVLEGEIIGFSNHTYKYWKSLQSFDADLLIDKSNLEHFRFLERLDVDVDCSSLTNEKSKRNHTLEEQIRGKNKAIVKVNLQNPSFQGTHSKGSSRWVVLKRVPPQLFHKSSSDTKNKQSSVNQEKVMNDSGGSSSTPKETTVYESEDASKQKQQSSPEGICSHQKNNQTKNSGRNGLLQGIQHCGDGNDSKEQQQANWRWLVSRYYDLSLSTSHCTMQKLSTSSFLEQIVAGGLMGRVTKIESSNTVDTLALVTIQPMILPEQTVTGRLSNHRFNEIFEICDVENDSLLEVRIPVEQLVIVSRKSTVSATSDSNELDYLVATHSCSIPTDVYFPTEFLKNRQSDCEHTTLTQQTTSQICHRCRMYSEELMTCSNEKECLSYNPENGATKWCKNCARFASSSQEQESGLNVDAFDISKLPCCMKTCNCRNCSLTLGNASESDTNKVISNSLKTIKNSVNFQSPLEFSAALIQSCCVTDFALRPGITGKYMLPLPQTKLITKIKSRKIKRPPNSKLNRTKKFVEKIGSTMNVENVVADEQMFEEDYTVFKPSCARVECTFERLAKIQKNTHRNSSSISSMDVIRNVRGLTSIDPRSTTRESDRENDRISSSRAARANQRRLLKDVASFGNTAASLGLLDSLANREVQLRFDRSNIHAFGVFADEDIAADEMIVEYRGELIENAMAEKREKEYEVAKIGSDYMFRVDSDIVCDATKQGNVARFINASCEPNCYTKIVPLDGTKRIVIYAKRDISAGEELSYDYKFPLEYDEKKRIPCHCGSRDCRGYMNWVSITCTCLFWFFVRLFKNI